MSKLSDLLQDTNDNIIKGWAFRAEDGGESFKLLKLDAIESEDGTEDAWVATVYDMASFMEFMTGEAAASPSKEANLDKDTK